MALEKDGPIPMCAAPIGARQVLHPLAHGSPVFATTQAHKALIPQLPQLIGTSRFAPDDEPLLSVIREIASCTESGQRNGDGP